MPNCHKKTIIGNINIKGAAGGETERHGNILFEIRRVPESFAKMCSRIMWKAELAGDGLGYLAEENSPTKCGKKLM